VAALACARDDATPSSSASGRLTGANSPSTKRPHRADATAERRAPTSGTVAVLVSLLAPVTAAVLAAVLLDEQLSTLGIAGIALIVLALAGSGRAARTPDEVVAPQVLRPRQWLVRE
jgi:hypothetical protein